MRKTACILLFALAACGSGKGKTPPAAKPADTVAKATTDTIPAAPKATKGVEEDAQLELAGYTVAVYSAYRPDSSQRHSIIDSVNLFTGNFIVVTNRATHAADTLSLEYMSFAHSPNISVKDITKDVGAHALTFILTYQGDSDNDYCEVVGYVNGELAELFDDPQPGGIIKIKKKDAGTWVGVTWYDAVNGREKRAFTATLKDRKFRIAGDDELTGDENP